VITKRSRLNELAWKILEFREDRIIEPMAIIGEVLDPIVENAIKKKGEKGVSLTGDDLEGETLLSYLVKLTDGGHRFRLSFFNVSRPPRPQDHPRRDAQYLDCREGYRAFNLSMGRSLADNVTLS